MSEERYSLWQEAREIHWFWNMNPEETREPPTLVGCFILACWWRLTYQIRSLGCRVYDHDIVCEDWGGPESGGMAGHCQRCGWGFSHTLY